MYFVNYIIIFNKRALSRLRWLKYVAFFSLLINLSAAYIWLIFNMFSIQTQHH